MRNLKKVLSLVLALAMMLSMMAFASAAEKKTITSADLTDMDEVNNKAAVSLLVDLGILNGIEQEDGTVKFAPAMGINRASWAKMVYYVMTGEADASAYKGLDLGLKDVAGHWAEGEIAYCVANKIASGDLEKNFYPDADITVVGAAKMLLTALGYDATLSKYENDQLWSLNIMNDAKKAGLMVGVAQAANEVLTRDNAAQMAYNALNALTVRPVVQYDMGTAYLSGYEADTDGKLTLGQQIYGLQKVTAVVTGLDNGKAVLKVTAPEALTDKTFSFAGSSDLLGQTVSFFVQMDGANVAKTWSSALIADGSSLVHTSANGTTITAMTGDKKAPTYVADVEKDEDGNETALVFLNGKEVDDENPLNDADQTKGNVVELYDTNGNGKIDVIKVTTKTAKEIAQPGVKVEPGPEGNMVSVPGVTTGSVPAATVVGYENLVAGDVVLVHEVDGVTYIEKAEIVTATASGRNSDNQVLLNGKYYGQSDLFISEEKKVNIAGWDDYKNEFNFYLDNGGQIFATMTTSVEAPAEYLYLLDAGWVNGGGGVSVRQYMEAQVLFADGSTEIVTIASALGADSDDEDTALDKIDLTETNADEAVKALKGAFWDYTYDERTGAYSLEYVETSPVTAEAISNKVSFDGEHTANSKTTFLIQLPSLTGYSYSVVTGYANLPALEKTGEGKDEVKVTGSVITANGYASLVFLAAPKEADSYAGEKNVYLLNPEKYSVVVANGNAVGYSTQAVKNGEVITIQVDKLDGLTAGFYNYLTNDAGMAVNTSFEPVTDTHTVEAEGTLTMSNGVIKVNDYAYAYTADTVVYVIDAGRGAASVQGAEGFVADATLEYTVLVVLEKEDSDRVKEIFVVGSKPAPAAPPANP